MTDLRKHVLIIDDNEPICDAIKCLLDLYGYQTTVRPTGADALNYVESLKPDLVVLDVMLDGYDGREICRHIKGKKETSHIPIIMLSASHSLTDTNQYACVPEAFVKKPFDIDYLIEVIEEVVK